MPIDKTTQAIARANERLKAGGIRARVEQMGTRLYLRGTFPPRPGSTLKGPKQQRLALGISATPIGIKKAEEEACLVAIALERGEFDWVKYSRCDRVEFGGTVAEWATRFEADYFARRRRSPKSETTWEVEYQAVLNRLPGDAILTSELLREAILATQPDTRTRQRWVMVCGAIAKFAGLDADYSAYRGDYSPTRTAARDLPADAEIAAAWESIPSAPWRYVYGLIATYGLRPHEAVRCDLSEFPILKVSSDTKTGSRLVYPLYPEWAELWCKNGHPPKITGDRSRDLGNRVTHAFARYGLRSPYNYRHAWAVRAIKFRVPVEIAAQQMGHSVQVHCRIYHQWISADFHRECFDALMKNEDRPKSP